MSIRHEGQGNSRRRSKAGGCTRTHLISGTSTCGTTSRRFPSCSPHKQDGTVKALH